MTDALVRVLLVLRRTASLLLLSVLAMTSAVPKNSNRKMTTWNLMTSHPLAPPSMSNEETTTSWVSVERDRYRQR